MKKKEYPSKEHLNKIFRYAAESGILYNRLRRSGHALKDMPAGCLCKSTGYLVVKINYKSYKIHRIIWIMRNGGIDGNMEMDHIDHNPANNRIENLRLVTHGNNIKNKKMFKNNTSGCMGVCWDKEKRKWLARITVKGKTICLGYFDNIKDAIKARKEAEIKYGFHPNHGK